MQPHFARYFLSGLSERLRRAAAADVDLGGQSLAMPIRHLVMRAPIFVAADATVQAAAQVMTAAGVSSVLVDAEPVGIVTDRDLRRRIVAAALPASTPVRAIMSQPLHTLECGNTVTDPSGLQTSDARFHELQPTYDQTTHPAGCSGLVGP